MQLLAYSDKGVQVLADSRGMGCYQISFVAWEVQLVTYSWGARQVTYSRTGSACTSRLQNVGWECLHFGIIAWGVLPVSYFGKVSRGCYYVMQVGDEKETPWVKMFGRILPH